MVIVTPISAFNDNYLWLLENEKKQAVIIDPGDARPVINAIQSKELTLSAILITHHHYDHISGVEQLTTLFPVPVYGPKSRLIPQITHTVGEGDHIDLLGEISLRVLEVPGHTQEHIAYYGEISEKPSLFCGDTLFAGGCGRLSGGTHQQLSHSIARFKQLPENTNVFCSHEYTLANLAFAYEVDPKNSQLQQRILVEEEKRLKQEPTLPSTIAQEKATNPFMRCHEPPIKQAINDYWQANWQDNDDLFAGLRRWKDEF